MRRRSRRRRLGRLKQPRVDRRVLSHARRPLCTDAYDCNGRTTLMVALHSSKPIDVVVRRPRRRQAAAGRGGRRRVLGPPKAHRCLAAAPPSIQVLSLGPNDWQGHLRMGNAQTDRAMRSLVRDIQLSMTSPANGAPHVILVGPPSLHDTAQATAWRMENLEARTEALVRRVGARVGRTVPCWAVLLFLFLFFPSSLV